MLSQWRSLTSPNVIQLWVYGLERMRSSLVRKMENYIESNLRSYGRIDKRNNVTKAWSPLFGSFPSSYWGDPFSLLLIHSCTRGWWYCGQDRGGFNKKECDFCLAKSIFLLGPGFHYFPSSQSIFLNLHPYGSFPVIILFLISSLIQL